MNSTAIPYTNFLGTPHDFKTFERGWAYPRRSAQTSAHYFVAEPETHPFFGPNGRVRFFKALCGAKAAATHSGPLFEAGKATRCTRCEAAAKKAGKA